MKLLFTIFCINLAIVATMSAKSVERNKNESDLAFVERISGQKNIENQFAKTKLLIQGTEALVAFTRDEEQDVVANLLVPIEGQKYNWIPRIACEVEGGGPEVESFFFANTDATPERELGVICHWPEHSGADCNMGRQVRFLKLPVDLANGDLTDINDKRFETFYNFQNSADGGMKCKVAKFKNASEIKTLLKSQGFK